MDEKFARGRVKTWDESPWALAASAEKVTAPRGSHTEKLLKFPYLGSLVGRVHCTDKPHTCQKRPARHCLKLTSGFLPTCLAIIY